MSVKTLLTMGLLSCLSSVTYAHSLFLNCEQHTAKIHCTGGFSDGSGASNLPIEVVSYDDEPLLAGKTNASSQYSFGVPDKDYYILLDAGPGHVVEVDMVDVAH